jgi:integrase
MKTTPTIRMLMEAYQKFAAVERMRMERPCEKTVASAVGGTRRLCEIGGISLDEPVSVLTRAQLERILDAARCSGLKPITVWSYLYSLRKLFAKWTRRYYDQRRWNMPQLEMPSCRRQSPRYVRPDSAVIARVKEWYAGLEGRRDAREWVLATLMLEFAMRNGDVERLRWADFRVKDGRTVLCYTPHKTRLSSGRIVAWPVHGDIWKRLCAYRGHGIPHDKRRGWTKNEIRDSQLVVPCARDVYVRLNRELRALRIFTGPKGCYELRKICIDHIYQKFGAEMASSISGDDIRTVMRYYADPSAVSVEGVRVVDLL